MAIVVRTLLAQLVASVPRLLVKTVIPERYGNPVARVGKDPPHDPSLP